MKEETLCSLQNRLVEAVRKYVQDETILEAFRAVPRDAFITNFYDRISPHKRTWRLITPDEPGWIEQIYSDRPLTTVIDAEGYPESSSSQPHLMALMLHSAHLRPGKRVLEIGTGTGYNAALLAHLVGPEQVITLDSNAALLEEARERIARVVGPGMTLLHADGRTLTYKSYFDAIIVTASHTHVEPSWITALAPGGTLVFNWSRSLTKVMLAGERTERGLLGHVCSYGGDFMPLRETDGIRTDWTPIPYERLPPLAHCAFQSRLMTDEDLRFFLQITIPSLHAYTYTNPQGAKLVVVREATHGRVVQIFPHLICGDASLWQEISTIVDTFERLGKPGRTTFSMVVDEHGTLTFFYNQQSFPLGRD